MISDNSIKRAPIHIGEVLFSSIDKENRSLHVVLVENQKLKYFYDDRSISNYILFQYIDDDTNKIQFIGNIDDSTVIRQEDIYRFKYAEMPAIAIYYNEYYYKYYVTIVR